MVKKRKTKVVCPHPKVFWSSKDNPTGYSEWKIKRGRQKKRWEDNITEWTGMDFASPTGATENKQDGKGFLRSHPWCPNDLARLRDTLD